MKNGPGQAWGQRSPVCVVLIGAGRNARSRAVTGVFGPGPRDMAVCHAIARPTHEYKNPLPLSQVRAGGRTWLVSEGWTGGVARQTAASDGPPVLWEGAMEKIWRDARYFRGMQGVGRLWSGDGKRTADVPRCAVLFRHAVWPSAGQGREALSGFVCGLFEGWRRHEGKGRFSTGDGRRRSQGHARHDAVASGIGSAMASPSPLVKELSSRSIPGRWPCP